MSEGGRVVRSRVRVRFAETDAQGVVYYGNYFVYFEVGRVDLLREARGSLTDEPGGGIGQFVVAHAECDYRAPARFDDELVIETWIERIGRTSVDFGHRVLRVGDGAELARGRVTAVQVDAQGRPLPIPDTWRPVLERYRVPARAGEPV